MNPPFSVAAHVDGRVTDTALRHLSSALARLAEGGRLVVITGANLSPDHPTWRDDFVRIQERGRIVFTAAIDGRVYARHGTAVDTRLTVIDRIPADDPTIFPASQGTAADPATLLDLVIRCAAAGRRGGSAPCPDLADAALAHRCGADTGSGCSCRDPGRSDRTRLRSLRLDPGRERPHHRRAL
jgi:hypothetical protein